MSDCCSPKGYRWIFSEGNARSEAKRYRRKGLDPTSRRIVGFLQQRASRVALCSKSAAASALFRSSC